MSTVQAGQQVKKRRGATKLPEAMRAKMWQKGVSPNPSGRKRGSGITDALLHLMAKVDDKTGLTGAQEVAAATLKLAKRGHPVALREVWERVEGKVTQQIDVTVEGALWSRLNAGRARLVSEKVAVIERTYEIGPDPDQQVTELDKGLVTECIPESTDNT